MKKTSLLALIISIALLPVFSAQALVTFQLLDEIESPSSIELIAGTSGNFTINITTNSSIDLLGVGYTLRISDDGSGLFRLDGRSVSGSPFTELQTSNATAVDNSLNSLLDPENNNDLGALEPSLTAQSPGLTFISTLTISYGDLSSPSLPILLPGTYILTLTNLAATTGTDVDPVDVNSANLNSTSYTINVIPEPTAAILLALGLLGLVTRRRR